MTHRNNPQHQRTKREKLKVRLAELEQKAAENETLKARIAKLERALAARSGTATFTERSAAAQN